MADDDDIATKLAALARRTQERGRRGARGEAATESPAMRAAVQAAVAFAHSPTVQAIAAHGARLKALQDDAQRVRPMLLPPPIDVGVHAEAFVRAVVVPPST